MLKKAIIPLRRRFRHRRWLADTPAMLFWAGIMGILGAAAVIAFHQGILLIQQVATGRSGSIVGVTSSLEPWLRVLFPTLGGAIAGVFLWFGNRTKKGATADYMEAVVIGDGRLSVRQSVLRSLSSLFTVSSGGSIGREGAMILLSSLVASLFGRLIKIATSRLRLLVACGAAAGVSAAYGAPLAGTLFVAEIILGSMQIQTLGPLLVAAASANLTMRMTGHYQAPYEMFGLEAVSSGLDMAIFVVLGAIIGVVAPGFLQLMSATRSYVARTGMPLIARLTLGGFILGLLLLLTPEVAGNGYSVVRSLLHDDWAWYAIVSMLFAKVFATVITVGSGAIGGVFTPALFVGAAFGALFASVVHMLVPGLEVSPVMYTLVGMGAFLGAATSAPLMAILMIFEMTLSYQLVLPLIMASVIAYFVSRTMAEVAMYDVVLVRERDELLRHTLRYTRINQLIKPAETVLPMTATVRESIQMFLDYPVRYIYIVDEGNIYQGVIEQQSLTRLLIQHPEAQDEPLGEYVKIDAIEPLTSAMSLDDAQGLFVNFNGERLPVVNNPTQKRLLGVVYKSALLERYSVLKRTLDASSEALLHFRR